MKANLVITRTVLHIGVVFAITLLVFAGLTIFIPWEENTGIDAVDDLSDYSMPWTNDSPFYPAEFKTKGNKLVDWRGIPSATFCAECHQKEYREWAVSIHAAASKDVIYENSIVVNELTSEQGGKLAVEKVRWCDGCHEPLAILAGSGTPVSVVGPNPAIEEGVTCIVCHTAVEARPLVGNAALTLNFNELHRYLDPSLIMAAPEEHAKMMQARVHNPMMGKSAMCGTCHTEIRPTRIYGDFPMHFQETFDEWRLSDYATQGIECQDCHMHPDPAKYVAALKKGERPERVVSHLFVGNNYLLTAAEMLGRKVMELRGGWPPGRNVFITGKEWMDDLQMVHEKILALLQVAADIRVENKIVTGDMVELDVVVTNSGAGHSLPTGPMDQRHMWIELKVTDDNEKLIYHNGWFNNETGEIDPDATLYIKQMFKHDGTFDGRHVLFDTYKMNYTRKPIRAMESDRVPYRFKLPAGIDGSLKVEAILHYRLALQAILKNITEFQLPPLTFDVEKVIIPPVTMVSTEVIIPLSNRVAVSQGEQ